MKKIFLLIMLFSATSSFAKSDIYDMGALVNAEIGSTSIGLKNVGNSQNDYDWVFKTIRVRVRPSVSLEIPWIAKAKLKPEIELFWTR